MQLGFKIHRFLRNKIYRFWPEFSQKTFVCLSNMYPLVHPLSQGPDDSRIISASGKGLENIMPLKYTSIHLSTFMMSWWFLLSVRALIYQMYFAFAASEKGVEVSSKWESSDHQSWWFLSKLNSALDYSRNQRRLSWSAFCTFLPRPSLPPFPNHTPAMCSCFLILKHI